MAVGVPDSDYTICSGTVTQLRVSTHALGMLAVPAHPRVPPPGSPNPPKNHVEGVQMVKMKPLCEDSPLGIMLLSLTLTFAKRNMGSPQSMTLLSYPQKREATCTK